MLRSSCHRITINTRRGRHSDIVDLSMLCRCVGSPRFRDFLTSFSSRRAQNSYAMMLYPSLGRHPNFVTLHSWAKIKQVSIVVRAKRAALNEVRPILDLHGRSPFIAPHFFFFRATNFELSDCFHKNRAIPHLKHNFSSAMEL